MKKTIIVGVILFLLFALGFGLIYLNNVFLPVKVKGRLADFLSKSFNYNVEIGQLRYSLIRGLIIRDLVVYDKAKDPENTLFTLKEASCHILFLPLIKKNHIIIPIMHVDSPYLHVRYLSDGSFNVSRLFPKKTGKQPKPQSRFSFIVYKINVFSGSGLFEDLRLDPVFTRTIQEFSLGASILPPGEISFLGQAKLLNDKGAVSKLSSQGRYGLASREFNAKVNLANLIVPEFNPYLSRLPVTISSGAVENSSFEVKLKDNLINLKGTAQAKGLKLKKTNLTLALDANITPELSYDLDAKKINYQVGLQIPVANLSGLAYLDKINNIWGNLSLTNNKLAADSLKFQALDSTFILKGRLENFANPLLKADIASEDLNLEKVFAIIPFKPLGTNLSGLAKVGVNIENYLNKLPMGITAKLELKDAKLQSALLKQPIDKIKGELNFAVDALNWLGLSFNYLNTAYTSTGKLTSWKAPQINFTLNSSDTDLKSDIRIKDNLVRINTLEGKYRESPFSIKGDIDRKDAANPLLNMYAKLSVKPEDASFLLPPKLVETLKKIKLEGLLNIKGSLIGSMRNYRSWDISANVSSNSFSVYGLKLNELSFNVEQKKGMLNVAPFSASAYSGIIMLNFSADLKPQVVPYNLKFSGSNIDLVKLKADTGAKDKDIAGILNLNTDLSGDFRGPSSLKGTGVISVKKGKLWQFNLFKGLGELFLLPDYEKVVFKEAMADCMVADKFVSTENLRLASDQMNLDCQGRVGFDGALDFTVYTAVNKDLIRDSTDIRKFTSAILGGLSSALTINVSGTIREPKYKIIPVPLDLIKNIKNFLLGR